MTLPKYNELTTVNRGAPCAEYPGEWRVYMPDGTVLGYTVQSAAIREARANAFDLAGEISVCWRACDDDPRIGQSWFTPFYEVCKLRAAYRGF